MEEVPGIIISCLKAIRIKILSWAVESPTLAITLVIIISAMMLPLVSAAALMPMVAVINVGNYVESKGLPAVLYEIFFEGLILAMILVVLFFLALALATVASVLHSYNFFQPKEKQTTLQHKEYLMRNDFEL